MGIILLLLATVFIASADVTDSKIRIDEQEFKLNYYVVNGTKMCFKSENIDIRMPCIDQRYVTATTTSDFTINQEGLFIIDTMIRDIALNNHCSNCMEDKPPVEPTCEERIAELEARIADLEKLIK